MSSAGPAKKPRERRLPTQVRQVELADAALELIATRGIAALTTRALAERVGLTSGAIFRHFPSLDALLDAVVARVETLLESTYPPEDLPARERLEHFIESRSTAVGNQLGILRLVSSDQFQLALPSNGSARLGRCAERARVRRRRHPRSAARRQHPRRRRARRARRDRHGHDANARPQHGKGSAARSPGGGEGRPTRPRQAARRARATRCEAP